MARYPQKANLINTVLACMLSSFRHIQVFATPWTIACQAPLSTGLSGQEFWSGLPCPPPAFSNQESSLSLSCLRHWQAGSLPVDSPEKPVRNTIPSKE